MLFRSGFENKESLHITCLRNPAVGREAECKIVPTKKPEKVLIAGGGIAGLEAAIILKQRGHSPILCEASDRLGGQFLTAGEAPRKEEMKKAVISMGKKAERIGVDIRINTKVTEEMIQEMKPHTVINAIGAQPVIPPIPGVEQDFVIDSHAVLNGKSTGTGNIVSHWRRYGWHGSGGISGRKGRKSNCVGDDEGILRGYGKYQENLCNGKYSCCRNHPGNGSEGNGDKERRCNRREAWGYSGISM